MTSVDNVTTPARRSRSWLTTVIATRRTIYGRLLRSV